MNPYYQMPEMSPEERKILAQLAGLDDQSAVQEKKRAQSYALRNRAFDPNQYKSATAGGLGGLAHMVDRFNSHMGERNADEAQVGIQGQQAQGRDLWMSLPGREGAPQAQGAMPGPLDAQDSLPSPEAPQGAMPGPLDAQDSMEPPYAPPVDPRSAQLLQQRAPEPAPPRRDPRQLQELLAARSYLPFGLGGQ